MFTNRVTFLTIKNKPLPREICFMSVHSKAILQPSAIENAHEHNIVLK